MYLVEDRFPLIMKIWNIYTKIPRSREEYLQVKYNKKFTRSLFKTLKTDGN